MALHVPLPLAVGWQGCFGIENANIAVRFLNPCAAFFRSECSINICSSKRPSDNNNNDPSSWDLTCSESFRVVVLQISLTHCYHNSFDMLTLLLVALAF